MCRNYHGTGRSLLLVLVFLPLGAAVVFSQAAQQPPNSQPPTAAILQLKADLIAASELVAHLNQSVALHLSNLATLHTHYSQAQAALALAQQQLQEAEQSSQQTSAQLEAMQINLTSLQSSLNVTKASLAAYKSDTDKVVYSLELQKDASWYLAFVALGAAAGAVADKGNWEAVAIGAAGGLALKVGLSLTIHF